MSIATAKLTALARRLTGHPSLSLALALAAIVLMLPALKIGLLGDDIIQRLRQLTPAELPARIMDTGFVPSESGKLSTVLGGLFAYIPGEAAATRARETTASRPGGRPRPGQPPCGGLSQRSLTGWITGCFPTRPH